jgi:hypothetical protein
VSKIQISARSQNPFRNPEGTDSEMLEGLRRATFDYFRNEVNLRTGLIADKTRPGSPSSIAAVGMALSVHGDNRALLAFTSRGNRQDPDALEVL